jgi:Cysteine-rich CPCC
MSCSLHLTSAIKDRSEYFICPICYGEDDGPEAGLSFSTVNGMFLSEAREAFLKTGVVDATYVQCVDEERLLQF